MDHDKENYLISRIHHQTSIKYTLEKRIHKATTAITHKNDDNGKYDSATLKVENRTTTTIQKQ